MILEVNNLSFRYRSVPVIKEATFQVNRGEIVSILGKNGAGKTTLLKCLNNINTPQNGVVLIEGVESRSLTPLEIARKIGWVPQSGELSMMSVFDLILLGRKPHFRLTPTDEDYRKVEEAIDIVGIKHLGLRFADELSGGEFQLVQIARAFAQNPDLILFDEPTSSLDIHNQYKIMSTIKRVIKESNRSAIMAMQDLNLALRYSDKFLLLKDGKIFASGSKSVITEEAISEVYDMDVHIVEHNNHQLVIPVV